MDRDRIGGHDVGDRPLQKLSVHVPSEVAVGHDAGQRAAAVDGADAAEALRGHDDQRLRHRRLGGHERQIGARVHDVGHPDQPPAELAARMVDLEVVGREPLALQQGDRQRIAQRQHHDGRRRRREAEGAGLRLVRQHERDGCRLGERARHPPHDGDERDAEALSVVHEVRELRRLAGVRQHQQRVGIGDHAEIAVARLRRVNEERRRPGRGEGRSHLVGDVAALAHAGDHDPAPGGREDLGRLDEAPRQRLREPRKRARFLAHHAPGGDEIGMLDDIERGGYGSRAHGFRILSISWQA